MHVSNKDRLKEKVRDAFFANQQIYGSYRIAKFLERENIFYSRSYVARLMHEMGLRSKLSKKYVVTTDSDHQERIADNKLNREFKVNKLGSVWVSDITYVKVKDDWAYLTVMIDLADRQVVGWSLSKDMTAENTVIRAWINARNHRDIATDFMLHSDRGVQYTCNKLRSVFDYHPRALQSMSRKGDCWDNAVAESFFKSIKYEELYWHNFQSFQEARTVVAKYMHWYNTKRLHSAIDYLTPKEKELQLMYNLKQVA